MEDPRTFEDITADTFGEVHEVLKTLVEDLLTIRLRVKALEHETVDRDRALAERVTQLEALNVTASAHTHPNY